MNKILSFMFLTLTTPLIPAFFFFIGIKNNYIDFYGINEHYNIIFVDEMSWILYWTMGTIFALFFISPFKRIGSTFFIITVLLSMSMFNGWVSHEVSLAMFAKKKFHIKLKSWTYSGVLLYEGRKNYYLLNSENNKTMTFNKEKIDEAY